MMIDLKIENYQELLNSDKIVLLDFYGPGCPACVNMLPVLQKIDEKYYSKITVTKLNVVDKDFTDLLLEYNIKAIPTFIILKNGEQVQRFVGYKEQTKLEKIIDQLL